MLVVDASVLIEVLAAGPVAPSVTDILREDGEWCAPEHLHIEIVSGLRGLWLGGHLGDQAFVTAVERLTQLAIASYRLTVLLPRIVELASRVTAYDAAYVALAEQLDCPLLTLDPRLRSLTGVRCAFLPAHGVSSLAPPS